MLSMPSALQERYAQADADLAAMKAEVETLEASREKLNAEIKSWKIYRTLESRLNCDLVVFRAGRSVVFWHPECRIVGRRK